jgi:hypothetical protein
MSDKFRNVVCQPGDVVQDFKRQILELISLNQTTCGNLPDLSIPNLIPEVPDLNPSQKVIDFLADILALVSGINFEEMRMQIVNWLVEQLEPLSEDLSVNFINSIKSCYACKINPKIPEWLFQIQPSSFTFDANGQPIIGTGTEGLGFNVELNKIDLTCIFAADPNTEIGKLFYDGDSSNDINAFLWEVIQENGNPLIWSDPENGKQILEVRYYENSPIAFTQNDGTVDYQNTEPRPRVFNFRVVNQSYENKTLINVLVDYFNSQQPLFDVDKVIPNVIDLLYGTLTNKIELPDECLNRVVELEQSISDYLDEGVGSGTVDINFDDSFYTFNSKQLTNIKEIVKEKKSGVKKYKKCCSKDISTISFDTLSTINDDIKNSSTLQQKISTYNKALDDLIKESVANVNTLDKDSASGEFLSNFITSLQIALAKLVLSPKNLLMLNLFYFLVNSKPITEVSIKKILKEYECIIVEILSELLRKLIYDFLLPLIIKALKNLIICVITKKIKEKNINYLKSRLSLLPGFVNDKLEDLNELFGKSENIVDKARGFTDKINLNSLNNINLQSKKRGRFCD